jgi:hypothetical protein
MFQVKGRDEALDVHELKMDSELGSASATQQ